MLWQTRTTTNADGTSTSTIPGHVITEEKVQKKNDVKARSMLLMALPNEHQLTFNQYKDAKTLFEAIQIRFGGNDVTKKTQKTLLKQMYENFNALSIESLDSIFNRLQKIVSQLAILGENISQEDLNLNSLNEVNTSNVQLGTANSVVSTDSTLDSTANLKTTHEDDLEEMDLKWQLALLSMRARRYYQRTGKKITINGSDTTGYDKSKTFLLKQWWLLMDEEVPTNLALMASQYSRKKKRATRLKLTILKMLFKRLDKLIRSQFSDNNRKGVGYNAVPPPPTGLFAPPTIDLSNSGLKEFQQPEFEGYGFKANKGVCENSSNEIKKTTDALIIKDWVFDCDEDDSEVMVLKYDNVQHKPEQVNQPKNMVQKPVLNNVKKGTGQREVRPVWNNAMRVNHQNFSNSRRNFVPTAVLTKSRIVPVSAARPINTAAPKSFVNVAKTRPNAFQKSHSLSRRPFYQQTALKNRNLNDKVNTAKVNSVNTAKGNRVTSVVGEQGINAVKSSACWVWRPKIKADSSLELKGYLINNGYADLVKMLYGWS
ncbi:hypothetical protein Tco_0738852 [Tanacetum coccineum]